MNSNNAKINKGNYVKSLPTSISAPLAEVYGALIGDGCLSTCYSKSNKRQLYIVMFTGHTHDFEYYQKIIRPTFIKEFGTRGYLAHRSEKRGKCIDYSTQSKRIFNWFKNSGFPVGKKVKLEIPPAIIENNKLSIACVRGIFNTDGSIYNRYSKKYRNHTKHYRYKNIEFKMNSLEVITQVKVILERNGINTSNIRKNVKCNVLNIHNQKFVKLFFKLVKPSNPYHKERFLNSK